MAGTRRTTVVLQERDLRLLEALGTMRVIDREQARVVAVAERNPNAGVRLAIGVADRMSMKPQQSSARDGLNGIHGSHEHFHYRPRFPNDLAHKPKLRKGFACILPML